MPVVQDGKTFRVFRDLTEPNLTRWEGDLPAARIAYQEAYHEKRIIPDVVHWHSKDKRISWRNREGQEQTAQNDKQYTLIGYGQDPEVLQAMGLTVTDPYLGTVAYDYDGEIQKQPGVTGRERLYPGYFGLGALLRSPENPNALVMPGIMHRMYDLSFTALMRAIEYSMTLLPTHRSGGFGGDVVDNA